MSPKILLTGGTSLLGNNVLELLLRKGYAVNVLVRHPEKIVTDLEPYDGQCTVMVGNITDYGDLKRAASGCDAVINCAGDTSMSHRNKSDYLPINRDLCKLLRRVALDQHLETLVHVSTCNTIGYGTDARPADEQSPMEAPFTKSHYAQSKLEGEKAVFGDTAVGSPAAKPSINGNRLKVVVINPGYIIGKYDVKPSSGKLLAAVWRRRIAFVPPGGKNFVGAKTVAEAVVSSLSRGKTGTRYLATGANLSFAQFLQIAAYEGGYRQTTITIPPWLCKVVGMLGNAFEHIGMEVSFTSRNIDQLLVQECYSNKRMVEELGVTPQPIGEAVREFAEWTYGSRQKRHNTANHGTKQ